MLLLLTFVCTLLRGKCVDNYRIHDKISLELASFASLVIASNFITISFYHCQVSALPITVASDWCRYYY